MGVKTDSNQKNLFPPHTDADDKKTTDLKSVVLFSNDCSFQHIELSSDSVEVLKYSEMSRWVKLLEGQVIPKDQINSIYISLKTYSNN